MSDSKEYQDYEVALVNMENSVLNTMKDEIASGLEDLLVFDPEASMDVIAEVQIKIDAFLEEQRGLLEVACEKFMDGMKASLIPALVEFFNRDEGGAPPEDRDEDPCHDYSGVPAHLRAHIDDPAYEHYMGQL